MINWVTFFGSLAWDGFSYFAQRATASIGFSIAGIIAVWKADIDRSLTLITLLIMCAMMLCALLYLCKLLADVFLEVGRTIQHRNNSLIPIIMPLAKLLLFSYVFFPVMNVLIHAVSFFPAIILYMSGHQKEAEFYAKKIMGSSPYGNR